MVLWVGIASAAVSAAASLGQSISGMIQKKNAEREAERAAARYRSIVEQTPVNQFAGISAKTSGLDLADEQMRQVANEQAAMQQEAGAAGVIGGAGSTVRAAGQQELQTAAAREQAQMGVEQLKAGEQARIEAQQRQDKLGLEMSELQGAQGAAMQGQQTMQAGLSGLASSAALFGTEYMRNQGLYGGDENNDKAIANAAKGVGAVTNVNNKNNSTTGANVSPHGVNPAYGLFTAFNQMPVLQYPPIRKI